MIQCFSIFKTARSYGRTKIHIDEACNLCNINSDCFAMLYENLSDKFIGWANTVYPKIVMYKTKLNMSIDIEGRTEIIKNLQKIIDNNPDLVLKLKKHFEADYELINRVKFYGD